MPGLLDLKTDLKSLKYGNDQPGYGSSNEPYIKVDINNVDTGFNRLRFTNFDDGLIRGGAVGAANASITDTLRIGKFLVDFPKGPLFIAKQVGLQLSNPRLESKQLPTDKPQTGGGFFNNVGNFISNTANRIENEVGPTRIYNLGINTLAQIPVNAIGGHIVRHGFLPNQDTSKYYEAVVTENNINGTNRLLKLTEELGLISPIFPSRVQSNESPTRLEVQGENQYLSVLNEPDPDPNMTAGTLNGLVFSNRVQNIPPSIGTGTTIPSLSYLGGPNSVYGIGYTDIKRRSITNYNENDRILKDISLSTTNNLTRTPVDNSETDNLITIADTGVTRKDIRLQPFIDPASDSIKSSPRDFTAVKYSNSDNLAPNLRSYNDLITAILVIGNWSPLYLTSTIKSL